MSMSSGTGSSTDGTESVTVNVTIDVEGIISALTANTTALNALNSTVALGLLGGLPSTTVVIGATALATQVKALVDSGSTIISVVETPGQTVYSASDPNFATSQSWTVTAGAASMIGVLADHTKSLAVITEYWHQIGEISAETATKGKISLAINEPKVHSLPIVPAHNTVLGKIES
jgi:hypothetical protein